MSGGLEKRVAKTGRTNRSKKRRSKQPARRSMAPWYLAGLLVIAGAVTYDNRERLPDFATPPLPAITGKKTVQAEKPPQALPRPKPAQRPSEQARSGEPPFTGTWYFCASRKDNCILDGNTIVMRGERIRIADVDTPRTKQAKCEDERKRGFYAQQRLRELLNQGKFTLASWPGRDQDADGEKLRVFVRDGRSIGQQLADEGLARPAENARQSWCG